MKIALSSTVSLMTKYVHKRPDSSKFQFVLRVPSELADRYPKTVIRKSLDTSDPALAMRRGDIEFARYQAEFARMRGDQSLKPAEVQTLAIHAAKELGTLEASEDYFDEKLQAWAKRQGFEDPSQFEHLSKDAPITASICGQLWAPIRRIALGLRRAVSVRMPVPEAAVNKDNLPAARENKVRRS